MAAGRQKTATNRAAIETGTRECALYTLVNVDSAQAQLREVRKNVRGDHKRRIDNAIVVLDVIALETKRMFAISDEEAAVFVREHRMTRPL